MIHRIAMACFVWSMASAPALAQASVEITAGNLHGNAQAGPSLHQPPLQRQAKGPRTDNCNSRSVTVRSPDGSSSSSASVSTSSGGTTVVTGGGSPGSRTEFFGCEKPGKNSRSER